MLLNTYILALAFILNNGKTYKSVSQFAEIPSFLNKLTVNYYVNNSKTLKKSYQLGIENEWQHLNSQMYLEQFDGNKKVFDGDNGNNLKWQRHKQFFNSTFLIKITFSLFFIDLKVSFAELKFILL